MYELPREIPDVDHLLSLQPEELGAKMLFLLRERVDKVQHGIHNARQFCCANILGEPFGARSTAATSYPDARRDEVFQAISEAWAWLEAQGLLVPSPQSSGSGEWRVLSRRAKTFEDEMAVTRFTTARLLPKEMLHPRIASKVWSAFMRGDFDVAVLVAMKSVEVAVREAAGLANADYGVDLMHDAFRPDPDPGPLTDQTTERSEQKARMALFSGAIGSYKNPHSHRDVNLDDPHEAIELILLANHLLRIVDARAAARASGP